MKKMKLESGFLFLYDWLPVMEILSGEEFKAFFAALIARQREDRPMPQFENPLANSFARMIEPTIQRRKEGAQAQRRGAERMAETQKTGAPKVPSGVPLPHSRAEQSTEEQSTEQYSRAELSGATEAGIEMPETLRALSEPEREGLLEKGIPSDYIEERRVRALTLETRTGKSATHYLAEWWQRDRPTTVPYHPKAPSATGDAFDMDAFFDAVAEKQYGEAQTGH